MRTSKFEVVLEKGDNGAEFGLCYIPENQYRGGFIFFHDYGPAGDRCYETEMPLSAKQLDMIMEWWHKERDNLVC